MDQAEPSDAPTNDDEPDDTEQPEEVDEFVEVIARAAELSLLGIGHVEQMFPKDLFGLDCAYSEEQEWRVAL